MKRLGAVVLMAWLIVPPAQSQDGRGGTAVFPMLNMAPGARPAAMGEAFTSLADDVNAMFYNPAGLADLDMGNMTLAHAAWFQEVSYEYFAIAVPLTYFKLGIKGSVGLSYSLLHMSEIPGTELGSGFSETAGGIDNYIDSATSYTAAGQSFAFGAGGEFNDFLDLGFKVKFPRQSVADVDMTGAAMDLGAMANAGNGIKAGFALRNLGGQVDGQDLPTHFGLGASRRIYQFTGWDDDLYAGLDAVLPIKPTNLKPKFHVGLEYNRRLGTRGVSLRAGYRQGYDLGALAGLSLGAGLGTQLGKGLLKVDYAFTPQGELGSISRFSVSAIF